MGDSDKQIAGKVRKKIWASVGTVGWVGSAVLFLVLASASGGAVAPPTVVHKAPYTGAVQIYQSTQVSQCAKASFTKPVGFNFKTGVGSFGAGAASAHICGKPLAGVGSYVSGSLDPQLEIAVGLRLPGGSHSVQSNWMLGWNFSGKMTYGSCPSAKPFANSYSYTSPSFAYWDNYSGKESVCSSDVEMFVDLQSAYVQDINTGAQTFAAGCSSSYCFKQLVSNFSYITNESGWEFYNYTTWNGTAYSYSHGVFSLNYTHTGPTSVANVGTMALPMWFNGTFNLAHHYALIFDIFGFGYASTEGWSSGTTSMSWNWATAPNEGIFLPSIAIT